MDTLTIKIETVKAGMKITNVDQDRGINEITRYDPVRSLYVTRAQLNIAYDIEHRGPPVKHSGYLYAGKELIPGLNRRLNRTNLFNKLKNSIMGFLLRLVRKASR